MQAYAATQADGFLFVPPAQSASDELNAKLNNCFRFSPHALAFLFTHSLRGVELNRVGVTL
jgi:hypothetical protein